MMVTRLHGRIAAALAGAAASLVFLVPPASAQQGVVYIQAPPNFRVERVFYGDLNLASRAGEQILQMRVARAIENVCLRDRGRWYGMAEPDYNSCAWKAMTRARPQMIGAVYRARQAAYYRAGYYRGY